jgi:hypothetical protein
MTANTCRGFLRLSLLSVENIQLNLKQKINIKGYNIRGCSLLPDGRMVFSCNRSNTVRFINNEGVELFQIGEDKTGSCTYDTVYIKDTLNSHCVVPCKSQHVTVLVLVFV